MAAPPRKSWRPRDRAREMLLMGLRLSEGIDPARFAARTGIALDDALDADTLARALAEGYLLRDHDSAPHPGRPQTPGCAADGPSAVNPLSDKSFLLLFCKKEVLRKTVLF